MDTCTMRIKLLGLFIALLLTNTNVFAQKYWRATGPNNNWSDPANWSTVGPGGAGPAAVPTTGETVIFQGSSRNCNMDVALGITIGALNLDATYTGAVSQNVGINVTIAGNMNMAGGTYNVGAASNSLTINNAQTLGNGFFQTGGTFNGNAGGISIYYAVTLSGGTFNSTSNTLNLYYGPLTFSGGTFNHNNGKVKLIDAISGADHFYVYGKGTFCTLEVGSNGAPSSGYTYVYNDTIEVLCLYTTTVNNASLNEYGGVINIRGDIQINNTQSNGGTGTTIHNINGTGTQTASGPACNLGGGKIPNVTIDKAPNDTLKVVQQITISVSFNYISGVIQTLDVLFFAGPITINGTQSISRVGFISGDITIANSITSDTLFYFANSPRILSGNVFVKGDAIVNAFTGSGIGGGAGTVHFVGTSPQILYTKSSIGLGNLPNVVINTVALEITRNNPPYACTSLGVGRISAGCKSNWTYVAGTITGNGLISFNLDDIITGSHTLPNVCYYSNTLTAQVKTVAAGSVLTVRDTLFTYETGRLTINGETHAKGPIYAMNTGAGTGGTGTITINGTGDQLFTSNYSTLAQPNGTNGYLPNITINKTAGTLFIADTLAVNGHWQVTDGVIDASTGLSNVFLYGTFNLDNEGPSGIMSFYDLTLGTGSIRTLTGSVGVNNRFLLNDGRVNLSNYKLSMNSATPANLVRTTGYVVSENLPAAGYGRFEWAIGNAAAGNIFTYPFAGTGATYIPFTFEVQTPGSAGGKLSVATYPTDWTLTPNNNPLPTGVTNINNILGASNFARELDRFWVPVESGFSTNPTGRLTFTYRETEWNLPQNNLVENRLEAHRWLPGTSAWQLPNGTSTRNTTNNTVTIPNQNTFTPFTLVDPELPDLRISSSDTVVCLGTAINFFDQNVPTPASSVWYFPGATPATSTSTNPTGINYTTTGCKDVILHATYAGGTLRDTFPCFITIVNSPTVTVNKTDVTCNGLANGKVWVTVSGGSPGYTYQWGGTASTQTNTPDSVRTGLGSGTYTITVNDAQTCGATVTATVAQPTALTTTVSQVNITCFNGSNGQASVTPTGGNSSSYTYSWTKSPSPTVIGNTATITGLNAGTYNVVVTDANGCTATNSVTLANPASLSLTLAKTDARCNGEASGKAWATVSGGTGAGTYTYIWSPVGTPGVTPDTTKNQPAGLVSVTVTDGNGCTATGSITIGQPTAITVLKGQTNLACNGIATGKAWARASGGTGAFTYTWSTGTVTGANGDTITNLGAGNYYLTSTDANGCIKRDTFVITQPTAIVPSHTQTNVLCNGANTGSITVTYTGGPTPNVGFPTYTWKRNGSAYAPTTATISSLTAATYTVIISINGCLAYDTITITEPTALTTTVSQVGITCFNGSNGQASVTASGGNNTSYTYAWTKSPSSTVIGSTATITGLNAGTYNVLVTDANGCTATNTVTLANPAQLGLTLAKTDAVCFGTATGKAWATVTGGTGPYTYAWSAGTFTPPNDDTTRNLLPGTVSVTVTDAQNCTVTGSITIGQAAAITTTTAKTNVTCFGGNNGTASVTATGGPAGTPSYAWKQNGVAYGGNTNSLTGLTAAQYTVIVTIGSCLAYDTVNVTEPTQIVPTITGVNVGCNGASTGSATVTYTGGPTGTPSYAWQQNGNSFGGNTATISNLTAGTYTVIVTVSTCVGYDTIVITQNPALSSTTSQVDITCFNGTDGEANVSVTGGTGAGTYDYSWIKLPSTSVGGNTATITGLGFGDYEVTVTDDSSCVIRDTVTLANPAPIGLQMGKIDASCFGVCDGEASVIASGGTSTYTYLWSNNATTATITGLCAGRYKVTVTDGNGCTSRDSVDVNSPTQIVPAHTSTNVSCFGGNDGSITVTHTGGPTPNAGFPTYTWQLDGAAFAQTTAAITNLVAGTYTVVININGCLAYDTVTITQPTEILTNITGVNVGCNGASTGSATVTYTGGPTGTASYAWQQNGNPFGGNTATITGLTAGTYTVIVTINTCTGYDTIVITENPALASTTSQVDITCFNGTDGEASVSVTGGTGAGTYDYVWVKLPSTPVGGNTATITGLGFGDYEVTVTDDSSCVIRDTVTLANPAPIGLQMGGIDASCFGVCDGEASVVASGGTSTYTYTWSNGGNTATITGLCAGRYKVTVTDGNGCTSIDSVDVSSPTQIVPAHTSTNVSCFGGSDGAITVTHTGGPTPSAGFPTYTWQLDGAPFGQTTATITNLTVGTYTVVISINGCLAYDTVIITQPTEIITSISGTNISCFGGTDGTATVTHTGGPTPNTGFPTYTWQLNGGAFAQSTATINNLSAGTYTVIVEINGCFGYDTIDIIEPSQLTSTITGTDPACNGGTAGSSVTVTASGGTPGTPAYNYSWTLDGNPVGTNSDNVTGSGAGTYIVTITDSRNCTINDTFTLNNPPAIVIVKDSNNVNCFGNATGKAWVTISGGTPGTPTPYTISWSGGVVVAPGDTIANLLAGTYGVTVTDGRGCTATATFNITEPPALGVTLAADSVSCFGGNDGKAWATGTGGSGSYTFDWTPVGATTTGPNGDTIIGLTAITYTVTVTDDSSCTAVNSIIILQPSQLILTHDSINVSCFGGNNGKAWVTASGGSPGYTYAWSGGTAVGNGDTITTLLPGTYRVTVTDANNCIAIDSVIITQPATAVTLVMDSNNVLCFGQTNGKAWVTASGGTPGPGGSYTYAWSGGTAIGLQDTIINLAPGTYRVTVTDANGCQAVDSVQITQPQQLTLTKDSINVLCFGDATGKAWVTINGGTTQYNNVTWTGTGTTSGPLNDTLSGLVAGTYTASVTDANGCTATATFTITQPDQLVLNMFKNDVACFGDATGKAWVNVTGGVTNYTYQWSGGTQAGANGDTIVNLIAGTYDVTVTDGNGCTATNSITIFQPAAPLAVTVDSTNILCFGQTTGKAWATVTGGTTTYTYTWSGGTPAGANGDTIVDLAAGIYRVTITDANGCTVVDSVNIVEPALLTVTIDSINVVCNGQNTGRAWATVGGGTGPFTYTWSSGTPVSIGDTIINLTAGIYRLTVTDANGCTVEDSVNITEPAPLVITIDSTNVTCNGANDGRAWVTATGGNGGYTYVWSAGTPGLTDDTIVGLSPGIYLVTVSDQFNCTQQGDVTIQEPNLLLGTIRSVNVRCFGENSGRAWITATGGNGGYTYTWSGGTPTNATGDTISGLVAGSYNVTITDSKGCIYRDTVVITEPTALASTMDSINVLCFGANTGRAWVTVTGGLGNYNYTWSGGTPIGDGDTVRNLLAGTYYVTVVDDTGCILIDTVSITQPATAVTLVKDSVNILCFGDSTGKAWVTASGGTLAPGTNYTYTWSRGTPQGIGDTVTNLSFGIVRVSVTDGNGCEAVATFNITQPNPLTTSTAKQNVKCFGDATGKAWVTASGGAGGYTYAWSGGTPSANGDTINNLVSGTYYVTVTDANGCTKQDSAIITQPAAPLATTMGHSDVLCFGGNSGRAWVNVTGGTGGPNYTYQWSAGVPFGAGDSTLNLPAGVVRVTVTDVNGCTLVDSITINQPATALSIVMDSSDVTCFAACDGKAWVTASGGTVGTGYTYQWANTTNTTDTLSSLCPGNYVVTVTDANGCRAIDLVSVNEPDELLLTITVDSSAYCNNNGHGQVTVSLTGGTGPYDYEWSNAQNTLGSANTSNTITGLNAGPYTVTVTDANGCNKTATITVGERSGPKVTAVDVTATLCNQPNGAISLTVTTSDPQIDIDWSHDPSLNGTTATGLASGNYTVTVTDASTCDTVLTIFVPAIDKPVVDSVIIKDSYCSNEDGRAAIQVSSGVPPYVFTWSHDTSLTTNTASGLIEGLYSVTVTDANGCDTSLTFNIVEIDAPKLAVVPNVPQTIYAGQEVLIEVSLVSPIDSFYYSWLELDGLDCYTCDTVIAKPERTTTYQVTVTDMFTGCQDTSYVTVIVKDETNIFIPNAITPNGDGMNDVWMIRELATFPDNEVIILNRWGDQVFSASPYQNDWDGTYNGTPLPAGTYYYIIKLDNISESVSGPITIVK